MPDWRLAPTSRGRAGAPLPRVASIAWRRAAGAADHDVEAVHHVAGVHVSEGEPEPAGCVHRAHFPVDLLRIKRVEQSVKDIFDHCGKS